MKESETENWIVRPSEQDDYDGYDDDDWINEAEVIVFDSKNDFLLLLFVQFDFD